MSMPLQRVRSTARVPAAAAGLTEATAHFLAYYPETGAGWLAEARTERSIGFDDVVFPGVRNLKAGDAVRVWYNADRYAERVELIDRR